MTPDTGVTRFIGLAMWFTLVGLVLLGYLSSLMPLKRGRRPASRSVMSRKHAAQTRRFCSPQDQIQWGVLFLTRQLREFSQQEQEQRLQEAWEWARQRADLHAYGPPKLLTLSTNNAAVHGLYRISSDSLLPNFEVQGKVERRAGVRKAKQHTRRTSVPARCQPGAMSRKMCRVDA